MSNDRAIVINHEVTQCSIKENCRTQVSVVGKNK